MTEPESLSTGFSSTPTMAVLRHQWPVCASHAFLAKWMSTDFSLPARCPSDRVSRFERCSLSSPIKTQLQSIVLQSSPSLAAACTVVPSSKWPFSPWKSISFWFPLLVIYLGHNNCLRGFPGMRLILSFLTLQAPEASEESFSRGKGSPLPPL